MKKNKNTFSSSVAIHDGNNAKELFETSVYKDICLRHMKMETHDTCRENARGTTAVAFTFQENNFDLSAPSTARKLVEQLTWGQENKVNY